MEYIVKKDNGFLIDGSFDFILKVLTPGKFDLTIGNIKMIEEYKEDIIPLSACVFNKVYIIPHDPDIEEFTIIVENNDINFGEEGFIDKKNSILYVCGFAAKLSSIEVIGDHIYDNFYKSF